jgi:hypothetical protein
MSQRACINNPNVFCYICGSYVISKQRLKITSFVEKAYYAYFGVKLGDLQWAPHTVCKTWVESLRHWSKGKKKAMPFGVPMVWREPQNHGSDCYFCVCVVKGHNHKSKQESVYPDLASARRPVPHGPDITVPVCPAEFKSSSSSSPTTEDQSNDSAYHLPSPEPQRFAQNELNDLVRELGLTKESAEVLGSRLSSKNLLAQNTSFAWYRHREKEFLPYFAEADELVYCCDIPGLIKQLGNMEIEYLSTVWRLFIDASTSSLKAALLHNGNLYASVFNQFERNLRQP